MFDRAVGLLADANAEAVSALRRLFCKTNLGKERPSAAAMIDFVHLAPECAVSDNWGAGRGQHLLSAEASMINQSNDATASYYRCWSMICLLVIFSWCGDRDGVARDRLKHIHLADSNRQAPGTGHIDFLQVVRTLNDIGFTGYLSLDSVPALPDWKTLVQQTLPFMKQIEQTVQLQDQIAAPTQAVAT